MIFLIETRPSEDQFRLFNHLIWVNIKIDMIFLKLAVEQEPCFKIGLGITSNLQVFDLEVYVKYFSLKLDLFMEYMQLELFEKLLYKSNYEFSKL